jgi:hypothetical protein
MAKVKNTGRGPVGFFDEHGKQITIKPGEEAEFNMTEADYKKVEELLGDAPDPKPYEISGGHGGVAKKKPEQKPQPKHESSLGQAQKPAQQQPQPKKD